MPDTDQIVVRLLGNVVQLVSFAEAVLTIGRTPDNGLPLPHPEVSRRHAEIRRETSGATLTDLGSSNGTFVDKQRILPNQPQILLPGASFRIGPFELTFLPGGTQDSSPEEGPSAAKQGESAAPEVSDRAAEPPPPPPTPVAPPRPTFPPAIAGGPRSKYLRYLPVIFQDADFLGRYLQIAESVWEPIEERHDHIQMYFDPRTCPAGFLPWLASWLGMSIDHSLPEGRQRQVLAAAMELHTWRGTSYGLSRAIEVTTGLSPTIEEMPDQPFVFRVRVRLPSGVSVDRKLIEDLIRTHKPAHAGYVLEVVT